MILSVQLDRTVITAIATGDQSVRNKSLVKQWCQSTTVKVLVPYSVSHLMSNYYNYIVLIWQNRTRPG